MKIAYLINTFKSSNWGGQATSNGIKHLLSKEYPRASFHPLDLPELRFKKIKVLRKYFENRLIQAILEDREDRVAMYLKKLNIEVDIFKPYSHICFNGEGAIHYKSGHLIRLMGLLYLAKLQNKTVATINQTIDLNDNEKLQKLVSKVYNMCDFVATREPISHRLALKIGIKKCHLIPDAVYGLPKISKKEIKRVVKSYNLPKNYITVTGSSILKRDKKSILKTSKILDAIQKSYKNINIIFMASTKTDIFLAKRLRDRYNLTIITSFDADYKSAIAIFANSLLLVGGRQHPNIFAYMYRVPYLGFDGNTFKNSGVAELQNYPYSLLSWDDSFDKIHRAMEQIKKTDIDFKNIDIERFDIFKKEV